MSFHDNQVGSDMIVADKIITRQADEIDLLKARIKKLEEALKFYADSDNWSEPKGGGSQNIFREWEDVSFNGFDLAEKALAKEVDL